MSQSLKEISSSLINDKKVQLIYAFNGTGKTRLSQELKSTIYPETSNTRQPVEKLLFYNAYTEDLFYWMHDLENYSNHRLLVHPNKFTEFVINFLRDESLENNIITAFQNYTSRNINPVFNDEFNEISFNYQSGGDNSDYNIKVSKGEESNFIWSFFYTLLTQITAILLEETSDRSTNAFDNLRYICIDDPVSSLDDNHLIALAVDLSTLIKQASSINLKFIITTHNPLFYNVLFNELNGLKKTARYFLQKNEDGTYDLHDSNDSPFSYHSFLIKKINEDIISNQLFRYHFNMLRNILEKTSTFLGYSSWNKLLPIYLAPTKINLLNRLLNLYSHYKQSGDELIYLSTEEKEIFIEVFNSFMTKHNFSRI